MADEGATAEDGMWIFKPAANCGGEGIRLVYSLDHRMRAGTCGVPPLSHPRLPPPACDPFPGLKKPRRRSVDTRAAAGCGHAGWDAGRGPEE